MNADAAAWAAVFLAAAAMIGGIVAGLFRMSLRPIKTVIENNTAVMELVSETITKHADLIAEHNVRLVEIETTHDVLNCKRRRMGDI